MFYYKCFRRLLDKVKEVFGKNNQLNVEITANVGNASTTTNNSQTSDEEREREKVRIVEMEEKER